MVANAVIEEFPITVPANVQMRAESIQGDGDRILVGQRNPVTEERVL